MYKLILLFTSLSLAQLGFSQGENVDVEGAITIANYESQNPQEGTIRWTGTDFEGYVNSEWKSLTCTCDDDGPGPSCPAQQYVDHTVMTVTTSTVRIGVELSTFMPMRFSYHPIQHQTLHKYNTVIVRTQRPMIIISRPFNNYLQTLNILLQYKFHQLLALPAIL